MKKRLWTCLAAACITFGGGAYLSVPAQAAAAPVAEASRDCDAGNLLRAVGLICGGSFSCILHCDGENLEGSCVCG